MVWPQRERRKETAFEGDGPFTHSRRLTFAEDVISSLAISAEPSATEQNGQNKMDRPFPLPSDFRRRDHTASIARAVLATARASKLEGPADAVRRLYPDDRETLGLVTRAESVPAQTTTGVWGLRACADSCFRIHQIVGEPVGRRKIDKRRGEAAARRQQNDLGPQAARRQSARQR